MKPPASPPRWFSGWFGARRTSAPDAADLGTAFGLDLSLANPAPDPPRQATRADWKGRLAGWRKPAP